MNQTSLYEKDHGNLSRANTPEIVEVDEDDTEFKDGKKERNENKLYFLITINIPKKTNLAPFRVSSLNKLDANFTKLCQEFRVSKKLLKF